MAECRSCDATVLWAIVQKGGKRIPLDPDPVERGNIAIVGEREDQYGTSPLVAYVQPDALPGMSEPRYVTHFATCPHADKHRKKGTT